jgi:GT2 family glycosyltransferase
LTQTPLPPATPPAAAPGGGTSTLSVSVIVCAYTLQRWDVLCEGIASIARQTRPALEMIVVVDHNPELLERLRARFPEVRAIPNTGGKGSSESRNTALALARGELLAFLDDDAVPAETWLEEMLRPYDDPDVIGTGGMPTPRWDGGTVPRWLPAEFYWTIGCGYRGLPEQIGPVRNTIGAAMSFRRSVFERIGGFSLHLGPVMSAPTAHGGGEDTELGIRALRAFPGGVVLHVPGAIVEHRVPVERTNPSYFRRRCWLEGRTKALMSATVGSADGLSSEWTYALKVLPAGVLRGLSDSLRGDLSGLQRAAAIVTGLAFTVAGYLWGRLTLRR